MGLPAPELSHVGGQLEFYYGDRLDLLGKTIAPANTETCCEEVSYFPSNTLQVRRFRSSAL